MAKARSPGYPAIGLGTAIEKVSAVYSKDAQNNLPREVVARHAGYNGITGVSLSMLSSLLKYGLLTGRGDNTSVSDLALQIIAHPVGSEERRAAILEAAFNPDLFAEIRDHYKGGKVSDQALRSYLLTRKFLPNAVDGVIRAYRETMELVEEESGAYHSADGQTERNSPPMQPKSPEPQAPKGLQLPPVPPVMAEGSLPFSVALTGAGLEIGARIKSESDIESLIQVLQTMKPLLPTIYGQPKATVVPPDANERAQRVFQASMEGRKNEEGVSFFVTQAQKVQLRERGYTDDQIRDMKPEDAHRALGLIN